MTQDINFPSGQKIYGTNTLFINDVGTFIAFPAFWESFPTYFPQLKRQVERAAAMGCNVCRVWGDVSWKVTGSISVSQYIANWVQVLQFFESIGMMCYPIGSRDSELDTSGITTAQFKSAFSDWLVGIQSAGMDSVCIGIDTINEVNIGVTTTMWQEAYTQAKGAGVTMAITSSTSQNPNPANDTVYGSGGFNFCDYSDFHVYTTALTQSDIDTFLTSFASPWQMLIGEYGLTANNAGATIRSFISSMTTLGQTAHARLRGSLQWACQDYDTDPNNQYGCYTLLGVARPDYVESMINGTATTAGPSAPSVPVVSPSGALMSSPKGTTNDYESMQWQRNGTTLSETTGRLDDASTYGAAQCSYRARVARTGGTFGPYSAPVFLPSANAGACRARGVRLTRT